MNSVLDRCCVRRGFGVSRHVPRHGRDSCAHSWMFQPSACSMGCPIQVSAAVCGARWRYGRDRGSLWRHSLGSHQLERDGDLRMWYLYVATWLRALYVDGGPPNAHEGISVLGRRAVCGMVRHSEGRLFKILDVKRAASHMLYHGSLCCSACSRPGAISPCLRCCHGVQMRVLRASADCMSTCCACKAQRICWQVRG